MARLEDLTPGARVTGVVAGQAVTVVQVQWHGTAALTLTYRDDDGRPGEQLLYRLDEATLGVDVAGPAWSLTADGSLFRLVSEARRIQLAYLFDPLLAVSTSNVMPLPHQITAVYERDAAAPAAAISAGRRSRRRQDHHGRPADQGADDRAAICQRCLIVCPGSLVEQWQDEMYEQFELAFDILTSDKLEAARTGNWFIENRLPSPASTSSRATKTFRPNSAPTRMGPCGLRRGPQDVGARTSAARSSTPSATGSASYSARLTRHLLLMTATPHNGKPEDFQLFLALLDCDRFEGKVPRRRPKQGRRPRSHAALGQGGAAQIRRDAAVSRTPRLHRQVQALRREADLYTEVTAYVREEMNRADRLAGEQGQGVAHRRRLRAHHAAAPPRLVARGDLPVAQAAPQAP